ncbi:unnamed protein product [Lota lota]
MLEGEGRKAQMLNRAVNYTSSPPTTTTSPKVRPDRSALVIFGRGRPLKKKKKKCYASFQQSVYTPVPCLSFCLFGCLDTDDRCRCGAWLIALREREKNPQPYQWRVRPLPPPPPPPHVWCTELWKTILYMFKYGQFCLFM